MEELMDVAVDRGMVWGDVTKTFVLPRKLMEVGAPGEVVAKPVVEELEREVVLTQHHLTLQKELIVMDHLVIDATLTIVMERKLMEAGVLGEVVVKPVVEELERDFVLTQNHLTIQKELIVMDHLVIDATLTIVMARKLMEAGVPGEVVVKPVVEELERDFVLTQHHLTLQKELIV